MKIACELCKKVFSIKDESLSSRGSTVYCPRCKHPHLVKRVVDPYPINPEFKVKAETPPDPRTVSTTRGSGILSRPGVVTLSDMNPGIPPDPVAQAPFEKTIYRWKELLSFNKKKKTSAGRTPAREGRLGRRLFLLFLAFGIGFYGYFSFVLPAPERAVWTQKFEAIRAQAVEEFQNLLSKIRK